MKKSFDTAIIGGGVNGTSIAFELAKKGRKVILLEKQQIAAESSRAAAGMLAAQAEIEQDGPLFQLALKSQKMFTSLSQELLEYSGIDIEFVQKGMLKIAETEDIAHEVQQQVLFQRKWDHEIRWLDSHEIRELEPALSPTVAGGMYLPNDGHVHPEKLTKAFAKAALHFGAEIHEHTEVLSFIYDQGKVKGLNTSNGIIHCEQVVIAVGAWANRLIKDLPVFPVKGECFSVKVDKPIINTTIFSDKRCYLVPKRNGEIYIGATMIENSIDKAVTPGGIASLIERAVKLVPEIRDATWERVWCGIRPQTNDGKPYIGEHPEYKGIFVATGHFRNGILLSPITGKLVADLLEGNTTELSAFRLDRHQPSVM
ncbi:glycine oxidase ThiO [Neobacillus sedimentimangrovi]|uniref:glycine oxidase ThiO n=1 Tax=Neobacillus sedimentimangrovi TaxID=2699460 RepID=UPI0013D684B0|nr:glycine oxidase ThiO [Neobacillus sedimentimangrovi]